MLARQPKVKHEDYPMLITIAEYLHRLYGDAVCGRPGELAVHLLVAHLVSVITTNVYSGGFEPCNKYNQFVIDYSQDRDDTTTTTSESRRSAAADSRLEEEGYGRGSAGQIREFAGLASAKGAITVVRWVTNSLSALALVAMAAAKRLRTDSANVNERGAKRRELLCNADTDSKVIFRKSDENQIP
uniref:Uncharacterized protein n=1 Tax=Pristionchus pacificus TaxID=54126 RepID=A0A2A6BIQ9_PRIPA|eukprot:PDM65733.1 hypothetical protein PRIPAC_45647 [Pristionchus pacificus]